SLAGALTHRFRRVFRREDQFELHLSLLRRAQHLYDTPFFDAIREHARRPAGVFHALPVSRGGSVVGSKWIGDFVDFYGLNLLLAESSATSGELDSLLAPVNTLKKAQLLAARAFGAKRTYFVTNGTSTGRRRPRRGGHGRPQLPQVAPSCAHAHRRPHRLPRGLPAQRRRLLRGGAAEPDQAASARLPGRRPPRRGADDHPDQLHLRRH